MSTGRAAVIALGITLSAYVASAPAVAEEPAAASGETIATTGNGRGAPPCLSCHGADGAGNAEAGFPRIAGQDAGYIARQLRLVRDGGRAAPVMAPVLGTLTDPEIDAVAAYYAALPAPSIDPAAPDAAATKVAEGLVRVGDWPGRDLPACDRCHGPGARGVDAVFPGLAGQHAAYLKTQLQAFATGARKTDPNDLMGTVARKLTPQEIDALSTWLAAQPATRPEVR